MLRHGPTGVCRIHGATRRQDQIMLTSADVAATATFDRISITGGVLADEAMRLFAKA
jgi:hypothetical protein